MHALSESVLFILSRTAKLLYVVYHKTIRANIPNRRVEPVSLSPGKPCIYVFWHAKTFLILPRFAGHLIGVLTLLDFKNLFYDRLCRSFGYQTVPVYSNERATVSLKKLIESGYSIALAVDGPKGPPGKIRPGALYLAQKMGAPIVAVRIRCHKSLRARWRWDSYEIPFPFSQAEIIGSEPFRVTPENSSALASEIRAFLGDYKE